MKINKNSSDLGKSAVEMLVLLAGVGAGYFVSGAGYEALKNPADSKTTDLLKRAGLASTGVASIVVGGKDDMANILKGAGVGIVLRQLWDGGKQALAANPSVAKLAAGNKLQKAIAGGLGLSCPCNGMPQQYAMEIQPLQRPARRNALKSPTLSALGGPETMSLDQAFISGKMLGAA